MKRMISVILVEDDINECNIYKEIVKEREDIDLVLVTNSSFKAINGVNKYMPDAVILDLELNDGEGSGFDFIEKIKELKISKLPKIVVTTNVHSAAVYDFCHKNNVEFVFYKGQTNYSRENIINTLLLLNDYESTTKTFSSLEEDSNNEEIIITKINRELDLIGISARLQGRKYITEAIINIIKSDGNERISINQFLSSKYKKSSSTINRAMQNAILHAWRISPIEDLSKYYTARVNYETGIPTVSELLYYYADKIKKEL